MEAARIMIKGNEIRNIVKMLNSKEDVYYQYDTKDVVVLMEEQYYMRIESNLMAVYILNFSQENIVEIEMVTGGGHHGVYDWGAERKELKRITGTLIEICKENSWEIVAVSPEGFKESLEKTAVEKLKESVLSWFKA